MFMECITEVLEGRAQVSSFQEVEVKEHVTLLPSYLGMFSSKSSVYISLHSLPPHLSLTRTHTGKVAQGVTELLSSRVLHYHAMYNGVLLTFSHVKIINRFSPRYCNRLC